MTETQYSIPVYKTEDYTIFKKLPGNRELYPKHVNRLVKVVEQEPLFTKENPIKLNERMEIIDGQHRVAAFEQYTKRTGHPLPVFYVLVKGGDLQIARALNTGNKVWTPNDFALAYAQEGHKDYQTYLEFAGKYKLSNYVLTVYLTNEHQRSDDFRRGEFKVKSARDAAKKLDMLLEVGQYYPLWPHQSFCIAFHEIAQSPNYDHKRMVDQMRRFGKDLATTRARVRELVPAIGMVYNWRNTVKVNLD